MEIYLLKKEIKELRRKKEEEENIKQEVQILREERKEMIKEMAALRKLVQDLCESPITYPALRARATIETTENEAKPVKGKPIIREIISIPAARTPPPKNAMEGIETEFKHMTVGGNRMDNEKRSTKNTVKPKGRRTEDRAQTKSIGEEGKKINITNVVNRIKEGKVVKKRMDEKKEPRKDNDRQVTTKGRQEKPAYIDQEKKEKGKGNKVVERNRTTWSSIVGRKANGITGQDRKEIRKGREPATAAIIVDCAPGRGEEILREARRKIHLQDLGINDVMRCSKAITGATVFEIEGDERKQKAAKLEKKLRETFIGREEIKIYVPTKMAEIKIVGLEESTTKSKIVEAIIGLSGCSFTEIKVNGIKANRNGMATAWVKCPVTVANKITEEEGIKIGWVKARTMLLRARPLQCYRCMRFGHVKQYCREKEGNSDRCYRCGTAGHKAAKCNAKMPKCFACEEKGRRSDHRMGGPLCGEAKAKGWRQPMRGVRVINRERGKDTEDKGMEITIEGEEEEVIKPKRIKLKEDQTQGKEEEIGSRKEEGDTRRYSDSDRKNRFEFVTCDGTEDPLYIVQGKNV